MGLFQQQSSTSSRKDTRNAGGGDSGGLRNSLRRMGFRSGQAAVAPKAPPAAVAMEVSSQLPVEAPPPSPSELEATSQAPADSAEVPTTTEPTEEVLAPGTEAALAPAATTESADTVVATAPGAGSEPTTERAEALYASGLTCVNDLTDALFFEAHPEARGADGVSRVVELGLAETWTNIRNTIARPVVTAHQPRAAETGSVALDATKTLIYDTIAADPARYASISEDEMNELIDLAFYAAYPEYRDTAYSELDSAGQKTFGKRYGGIKNGVVRPAVRAYYLAQSAEQMDQFRAAAAAAVGQTQADGVQAAQVFDPASGQWVAPTLAGGTVDEQLQSVWDTYSALYRTDREFGPAGCNWASVTTLMEMGWSCGGGDSDVIGPDANENGTTPLTPAEKKLILDTMVSELSAGHPVLIGVDYKSGNPGNADRRTDHWLVVVAMTQNEAGQRVFLGMDNADVDFSAITAGCAVAFDVDADNTIQHAPYRESSSNAFSKNGHTIVQVRRTTAKGATEVTRALEAEGAASPEPTTEPSADAPAAAPDGVAAVLGRYATGYAMGMYASLDEDALGRDLASRAASDPELVRSVFRALYDADRDDVALAMVTALPSDAALRACGPELLRELGGYLDGGLISWTSGAEGTAAERVRRLAAE